MCVSGGKFKKGSRHSSSLSESSQSGRGEIVHMNKVIHVKKLCAEQ